MKSIGPFLLFTAAMFGAVDGTVMNQTTNKPQPNATVTLIRIGQGMEQLGTVKADAQGHFSINQDLKPGSPHLLQAGYQGVTYNKMIPPGTPSTDLRLFVFEASPNKGGTKVIQDMVLLEPGPSETGVSEVVVFHNDGKTTYFDPKGSFRFYLPAAAGGRVNVQVTGPGGMPIARQAEKTDVPNVYTVNYPVKPGETHFDLAYTMPAGSPGILEGKLMNGGGPLRIIVPKGVTVAAGGNLKNLGTEPRTQASIYEVQGDEYKVEFNGTGSLRPPAEAAGAAPSQGDQPEIEARKPRIYDRLYPMLGLVGMILFCGFFLLYRKTV
jgi:hypothetical protein